MKKFLIIFILAGGLLTGSGCTGLETVQFWKQDEKESRQALTENTKSKMKKNFNIITADQINGQEKLSFYNSQDYAEIASFIQKSTLDNFISGILQGEKTKTGDNPYLVGENTKEELEQLEEKIMQVNPVDWKIIKITPVKDEVMLVAVEYRLPDGRTVISDKFMVKFEAENWFIDFKSFDHSFTKVAQFAAAGRGPS